MKKIQGIEGRRAGREEDERKREKTRGSMSKHAPACYGSSLGSNPDISQKYKMGDIGIVVANTL